MATNTGAPSTSAIRISTATGQARAAACSEKRPRAKAAGMHRKAIARPARWVEALPAKRSAMRPRASGITHSLTQTGRPPLRTFASSRLACTTPTAA